MTDIFRDLLTRVFCLLFRACHSFAIYYLLNERLKRYERQKRQKDKGLLGESSFAKVKVVRKAKLTTDVSPKSKFTYKGVKITKDGLSQTCIMDENEDNFARSDGESVSIFAMFGV